MIVANALATTGPHAGETTAFGGLETREPPTDAQIDGIARELLARLNLEEKVALMSGGHDFFPGMLRRGSASDLRDPLELAYHNGIRSDETG